MIIQESPYSWLMYVFFFHFLHLSVIIVMEIWIYLDHHLNGSNGVEKHKTFVESLYINMIVNSELDSTLSLVH